MTESQDYRFIRVSGTTGDSNFKFAADIDYQSFIMQYHIGILAIGTVAWMMQQTIEKYCKAILYKTDPEEYSPRTLANPSKYGHKLDILWEEIKKHTTQFAYEPAYEDLVREINQITTHARYMNYSMEYKLGLIETFIVVGCEFRYEILGREEFHSRFFGMQRDLFLPQAYLNNFCFNELFQKLLHFTIEHGYSFSHSGIADTFEWTGVELSRATGKFCQCGKHPAIEAECPVCNRRIWVNGNRGQNDGEILLQYFGINNGT